MPRITIGASEFLRGASDTDFSQDGGYSSALKRHNLLYTRGLLAPTAGWSNSEGITAGEEVIAGSGGNSTEAVVMVSTSTGGAFYKVLSPNDVTDREEDQNNGRLYKKGVSDILVYNDETYASSDQDVAKDVTEVTPDYDWWSDTLGEGVLTKAPNVAHHMLEFDETMLISNGNAMEYYDGSASGTLFTLSNVDDVITCFTAHKNKIYICATDVNEENSKGKKNRYTMYVWDGTSVTAADVGIFDDIIKMPSKAITIKSFKGSLLVFFEDNLSRWNGVNFNRIRTLGSVVYKGNVVEMSDRLFIQESGNVMVFDNSKFWYLSGDGDVDGLYNAWGNYLGCGRGATVYAQDITSRGGSGKWASNWYNFPMNIIIRSVQIVFGEDFGSGQENIIKLVDQEGDTLKTMTMIYSVYSGRRAIEFRNINQRCSDLQVQLNTFSTLIKRIIVEYDFTKQPIKKT